MPTTVTPIEVDLYATLKQHFSFDEFRPGQREVIEHLLAGNNAAAVFPTGGGKSLCYQLPALLLPGLTLVVSPLIALMKDQIDALAARSIAAARLDSTLSADEYRQVMEDIRSGRLRLLYVAPERFNNERFREMIARVRVSLFAVDEAHCISEWGHNFRPDYLKLAAFAQECKAERLFALTATATESVLQDICREFHIKDGCAVRTGFYRDNLTLLSTPVSFDERDDVLLGRLHQRPRGPTIVYVTLQRTSEEVAARLASAGLPARHYHAGMKNEQRAAAQDWFIASDDGIVVATIAFGMGIDKANIRYVYHYNPPKSLENYSQEIGRAGRDGVPATCEMFLCRDDLNVLENFIYGDTPTAAAVRSLVEQVFSLGENFDLSIYDAAHKHDIRELVVRTLLTYLQLEGYLEGGTPFYANYQFKPRMSSAEILTRFEGERRDFVARMLAQAVKAKTWFSIDLERAATRLGAPRERIVRALDYLGEQQMLEVKVAGVRHRFHVLQQPADLAALSTDLCERMQRREEADLRRLAQIVELVEHDGCQTSLLGAYFGEPLEQPCGHCSWCLSGGNAAQAGTTAEAEIDEASWQRAVSLRSQRPEVLGDPVALARFLCGISSPRLARARLARDPLFGSQAAVAFGRVLARAKEL
ncbi:MAG: RecQ family ATP-dependent DNA helicase [Planctomycetes bacterium]|nr:RecQ family ATP-dependent DNA helicase [Planctomycetota bacterium]